MDYLNRAMELRFVIILTHLRLMLMEKAIPEEYCEWETFTPTCERDQVVIIEGALYGRMRKGNCITEDRAIGCRHDVTSLAHRKCSGRRTCDVTVPDRDFEVYEPCGEMENYLSVKYSCIKVEQGMSSSGCARCERLPVTQRSGYISSIVTQESNCGGADCPWLIEAGHGQKIRITVYDFNITSPSSSRNPTCVVYAVLKEIPSRSSTTVCGGRQYVQEIEVTEHQSLEVRVIASGAKVNDGSQFLMRYQVIGCADMEAIDGADAVRNKDVVTVSCHGRNDQSWKLTCNSTSGEWEGEYGECTGTSSNGDRISDINFSYGISLVLIVAIAFFVGICILIAGLLYFRKRFHPRNREPRDNATPVEDPIYDVYGRPTEVPTPYLETRVDRDGRKFYQTYAQAQDMRNEYMHIWERPLPEPSSHKQPQEL